MRLGFVVCRQAGGPGDPVDSYDVVQSESASPVGSVRKLEVWVAELEQSDDD